MEEMQEVEVTELADDAVLLDVREDDEWAAGRAPGAIHIPMGELPARLADLPEIEPLTVICRSGGRSARVVAWLEAGGFDAVNVSGGTLAWAAAGKPLVGDTDTAYVK